MLGGLTRNVIRHMRLHMHPFNVEAKSSQSVFPVVYIVLAMQKLERENNSIIAVSGYQNYFALYHIIYGQNYP